VGGAVLQDELAARRPLTDEQRALLETPEGRLTMDSVVKLISWRLRSDRRIDDADELRAMVYEQCVHAARVFDPTLAGEGDWAGFASRYVYQKVLNELNSPRYRPLGGGGRLESVQDLAESGYVVRYPAPREVKLEDFGNEAAATAADKRDAEETERFAKKRMRFHLGVEVLWSHRGRTEVTPEDIASEQELGTVLAGAIASLPGVDRMLVLGHFWENKTLGELGQQLEGGRSARTARRALDRALAELGRALVYRGLSRGT